MFLDRVKIWVRAGDGGDGAATFRREAHVPRGGPDGGDGGRGGSIYLEVDAGQTTLRDFQVKRHFKATPGGRGERARRHGKAGDDLVLTVPPGTAVHRDDTGELIADLVAVGQRAMVARGGRGGLGNTHFKTATHQAPRHAQKGEPGTETWLRLELRLIADVGLVGLPNAGKSTLLAALTAAQPKIADYPFTTLEPNLGVMDLGDEDERRPTIADVPGLIEGASAGAGLGHAFLRHVERTRILVHIVDGASRDPEWDHEVIRDELGAHDPALLEKPMLVVFNKLDLPAAREAWPAFRPRAGGPGPDRGRHLGRRPARGSTSCDGTSPISCRMPRSSRRHRSLRASSSTASRPWATASSSTPRRTASSGSVAHGSSGSRPRRTSTSRSPPSGSSATWRASASMPSCGGRASAPATSCGSAAPSSSGNPRTWEDR